MLAYAGASSLWPQPSPALRSSPIRRRRATSFWPRARRVGLKRLCRAVPEFLRRARPHPRCSAHQGRAEECAPHPAIRILLLQAAEAVNGKESFLEKRSEFPSFKNDDIDKSDDARIFYKSGTPLLMRYIPFWLAEFFSWVSLYILPPFLLSYPAIKLVLDHGFKQGRIKIYAVYRDLAMLENRLARSDEGASREDALSKLNQMERAASSL